MSSFSLDTKNVLAHCTEIAERIATELSDNGFVDGPANIRAVLPLNTTEKIDKCMDLLPKMRRRLLERVNGARGLTEGEVVCISFISELYGVLEGLFKLPAIDHPNTGKLFPSEASTGVRQLELD